MTLTSSVVEILKLKYRASWLRQADGTVSRGPVQHHSPGRHYKHLAPLAPVIHGCLLPSNRTHREFARWRNDTTNNYIPTPCDEYVAPFKTSLILKQIWCRRFQFNPGEKRRKKRVEEKYNRWHLAKWSVSGPKIGSKWAQFINVNNGGNPRIERHAY